MPSYGYNYFPGLSSDAERKFRPTSSSDEAGAENATQQHPQHAHVQGKNGGVKGGRRKRPSRKKDPANPESLLRRLVANSQERDRMHGLNDALDRLRRHIPLHLGPRRLSKIKTLRLAMAYIEALTDMVQGSAGALSYPDSEDSFQDKSEESEAPEQDAGKPAGQRFSGQAAISGKSFFGRSKERGKGRMRGHGKGAGRSGPGVTRPSGYTTGIQRCDGSVASFRASS
ncbi:hypothetical protein Bbelb_033060 [Branchiostoma belcheri]|nr:hypothetical protein Bbelb_033060 [Branchiostoma belcheri]